MSGPRSGGPVVRSIGWLLVLAAVALGSWQALAPETTPWNQDLATPDDDATWPVVHVIDGDTLDVRLGDRTERVRLIAVDTPERDRCGYAEARAALAALVGDGPVHLVAGSPDDRDQYDRLLRYVEVDVDGRRVDAGMHLLEQGLAVAVFDSRRGYPRHDREDAYIAADDAAPDLCPDMRDR